MFATIGRSWEFAKISYGIIWDYKRLLIFPILSTIAAILVLASFVLPLWQMGTLEQYMEMLDEDSTQQVDPMMWVLLFLFYFCSYFVIIFFNSGLTACAMKVVNGEEPTVGYGLSVAAKRLPQILGWALVSAVIGVGLRMIENANEKAGRWIAAILGTAWTAMTFFVVPVIVVDGVGPVNAFKRSLGTLKSTWGEALVGNFSLGFLSFLIMLPVLLVVMVLGYLAFSSGNTVLVITAIGVGIVLLIIATSVSSAADVVFKALLYNYATGKSLPTGIDSSQFRSAFKAREEK